MRINVPAIRNIHLLHILECIEFWMRPNGLWLREHELCIENCTKIVHWSDIDLISQEARRDGRNRICTSIRFGNAWTYFKPGFSIINNVCPSLFRLKTHVFVIVQEKSRKARGGAFYYRKFRLKAKVLLRMSFAGFQWGRVLYYGL